MVFFKWKYIVALIVFAAFLLEGLPVFAALRAAPKPKVPRVKARRGNVQAYSGNRALPQRRGQVQAFDRKAFAREAGQAPPAGSNRIVPMSSGSNYATPVIITPQKFKPQPVTVQPVIQVPPAVRHQASSRFASSSSKGASVIDAAPSTVGRKKDVIISTEGATPNSWFFGPSPATPSVTGKRGASPSGFVPNKKRRTQ